MNIGEYVISSKVPTNVKNIVLYYTCKRAGKKKYVHSFS